MSSNSVLPPEARPPSIGPRRIRLIVVVAVAALVILVGVSLVVRDHNDAAAPSSTSAATAATSPSGSGSAATSAGASSADAGGASEALQPNRVPAFAGAAKGHPELAPLATNDSPLAIVKAQFVIVKKFACTLDPSYIPYAYYVRNYVPTLAEFIPKGTKKDCTPFTISKATVEEKLSDGGLQIRYSVAAPGEPTVENRQVFYKVDGRWLGDPMSREAVTP